MKERRARAFGGLEGSEEEIISGGWCLRAGIDDVWRAESPSKLCAQDMEISGRGG